ncbi:hypothetical protein TNCV_3552361 [Trichonephila clavipes]|nr:hypothetical protein TNCV_3552361 [Trichonephila clavipes]
MTQDCVGSLCPSLTQKSFDFCPSQPVRHMSHPLKTPGQGLLKGLPPPFFSHMIDEVWHRWFVANLLHPRLRVRLRPKSGVDFHDAVNRQRPCI